MTPKSASQQQTPLDAAYRYLSYRPRSEFEMRVWLGRKGYGSRTIESTLSDIEGEGVAG